MRCTVIWSVVPGTTNLQRRSSVRDYQVGANHVQLKKGLWQTLVQVGTENGWSQDSFREASGIFESLDEEGRLNRRDVFYQRFKALQRNPKGQPRV